MEFFFQVNSSNQISIPRLPPNPTRVDRLIVDHFREHARVTTLCQKMERLRAGKPVHANVNTGLKEWLAVVKEVQKKRKDEIQRNAQSAAAKGHPLPPPPPIHGLVAKVNNNVMPESDLSGSFIKM